VSKEQDITGTERRRFRAYPKYKNSGMKLIGSIPIEWHIKPIFALYERRTQRKHEDLPLLSVYRDYGVIPREDREDNFNRPSLDLSPYQLVENRDLVLNKMKTWQGSIAVSELRGIVSPAYIICRPRHGEHDRYMHYLLRAPSYITQYASLSYGVRVDQWDLRFEDFRRIQVLLPPVEDQRAIAAFLDCETGKIDALIAKKERLIELLQEKRTALINRAVTKGLDPNVPMKDSGVEWLGKIPAHWEVRKWRYCCRINEGQVDPKDDRYRDRVMIAPNHIESGTGRILFIETAEEQGAISGKYKVRDGELIYSKIRPALNKACIAEGNWLCSADMYPVDVTAKDLRTRYLLHFILSESFVHIMVDESMRVAMPKVNRETLAACPLLVPTQREQGEIVGFLDRETAKIDAFMAKIQEAICRLKEYRTALISAAVTGKIDIRDEVRW
jgi:type I restriction enzyme S subunit